MERPTRTFKTSLGNEIEIKTYFTQGERVQVQKMLAGESHANETPNPKTNDLLTALERALTLAIVKVNGNDQNPADYITNQLPASEYDEVAKEVLKLVTLDLQTAK